MQWGISCFEEVSMLIEWRQEGGWLRPWHTNKGRFALASSQEDINISKLLWKEYLRDLISLGNIWIDIINGIKKSQCSNFCQAPGQKKTESWDVIGKYLNCEPDLWMPWRNTEDIESMYTFLNGKNNLKYFFPKQRAFQFWRVSLVFRMAKVVPAQLTGPWTVMAAKAFWHPIYNWRTQKTKTIKKDWRLWSYSTTQDIKEPNEISAKLWNGIGEECWFKTADLMTWNKGCNISLDQKAVCPIYTNSGGSS